jgi:hypothetical protein
VASGRVVASRSVRDGWCIIIALGAAVGTRQKEDAKRIVNAKTSVPIAIIFVMIYALSLLVVGASGPHQVSLVSARERSSKGASTKDRVRIENVIGSNESTHEHSVKKSINIKFDAFFFTSRELQERKNR